jgi:hypothetical protein
MTSVGHACSVTRYNIRTGPEITDLVRLQVGPTEVITS